MRLLTIVSPSPSLRQVLKEHGEVFPAEVRQAQVHPICDLRPHQRQERGVVHREQLLQRLPATPGRPGPSERPISPRRGAVLPCAVHANNKQKQQINSEIHYGICCVTRARACVRGRTINKLRAAGK